MVYLILALHIALPLILPVLLLALLGKGKIQERWVKSWQFVSGESLIKQKLFWACLIIPGCLFVSFGLIAWEGYSVELTSKGLEEFIKISKLPLALLSMAIPFGAIAASFHSTEQTARTISNTQDMQKYEEELRKYNEKIVPLNTLALIRTELEEAWKIYYAEYAAELLKVPTDEPYIANYPLGENLFPIYENASTQLANVPFVITADIVHIHMRIKGLITTLNNNNRNSLAVRDSAVSQADEAISDLRSEGEDDEDALQSHWQKIFQWRCAKESHNLGMKHEANSLKALTNQLHYLLESVILRIDDHLSTNTPARPTLPIQR